jgi:type VI secretion system secreted protein Hcp
MSGADYYLKIDGVDGESKAEKQVGSLQIESFSFGASNTGSAVTGQGLGTGKVSMQDFHFMVSHSKASASLFGLSCSLKHIPKVVLSCRKSGDGDVPVDYMVVTFKECVISNYQTGGSNGSNSLPMDQISFNFTNIKFETKIQDEKGIIKSGTEASYDLKTTKKS